MNILLFKHAYKMLRVMLSTPRCECEGLENCLAPGIQPDGARMRDDWVRIRFPDNLEEMFEAMSSYAGDQVGWCLPCNAPIHSEADLIPGASTHNCKAGRALDAKIAQEESQSRCGHRCGPRRS